MVTINDNETYVQKIVLLLYNENLRKNTALAAPQHSKKIGTFEDLSKSKFYYSRKEHLPLI